MAEKNFLKMFLEEIEGIEPCDEKELAQLLKNLKNGDTAAKERLIEGNLHEVLNAVIGCEDCGLPVEDLVAEGNLALVSVVDEVATNNAVLSQSAFSQLLKEKINGALAAFIDEEGAATLASAKLEAETNRLMKITKEFEEETGQTASLSELAKLSGLSEDEVEELIRISVSAANHSTYNS